MQASPSLPFFASQNDSESKTVPVWQMDSKLGQPAGDLHEAANSSLNLDDRHLLTVKNTFGTRDRDGPGRELIEKSVSRREGLSGEAAMLSTSKSQPITSPKTLFRQITTKLRLPLTTPASSVSKPPHATNAFASRENREAALRERGLLPPLRPNLDLSAQERVQDLHYSVIVPIHEAEDRSDVTAATRIKQEWEMRNKGAGGDLDHVEADVRIRLQKFKFGGSTTSLVLPDGESPSIPIENAPAELVQPQVADVKPIEGFVEVSSHDSETPTQEKLPSSPVASVRSSRSRSIRPPALDLSQTRRRSLSKPRPSPTGPLPALPSDSQGISPQSIPLPPSPLVSPKTPPPATPRTPTGIVRDPCLVPLPLSPSSTHAFTAPLPPSPHSSSAPLSPRSPRTISSSLRTPKISHQAQPSSSPKQVPALPTNELSTASDIPAIPNRGIGLLPAPLITSLEDTESISNVSAATPSLVTPSQACTATSTNSSVGSASSKGACKMKLSEYVIPVILEGVIEDKEVSVKPPDESSDKRLDDSQIVTPVRRFTDSSSATDSHRDRRKSLAIFRRQGDNIDSASTKVTSSSPSKNNALSKLRRSVFGTLSRSKPSEKRLGASTSDASHLPPSPTLPASLADQAKNSKNVELLPHSQSTPVLVKPCGFVLSAPRASSAVPSPQLSPRQALSPKIHSHGSILLETCEIEDEESRRLSELAFLG